MWIFGGYYVGLELSSEEEGWLIETIFIYLYSGLYASLWTEDARGVVYKNIYIL